MLFRWMKRALALGVERGGIVGRDGRDKRAASPQNLCHLNVADCVRFLRKFQSICTNQPSALALFEAGVLTRQPSTSLGSNQIGSTMCFPIPSRGHAPGLMRTSTWRAQKDWPLS